MGTKTYNNFADRMDFVLQDPERIRWNDTERKAWINDGIRATVLLRPDAFSTTFELQTVAGSLQRLPAASVRLLEVLRNVKADGTAGRPVRLYKRNDLDVNNPGWHATPGTEVRGYCFDLRDPKVFYVYPQPPVGSRLTVIDSRTPPDMVGDTDVLPLDDQFFTPILNYALALCYSKDAEFVPKLRDQYMTQFMNEINAKTQVDGAVSPNAVGTNKP